MKTPGKPKRKLWMKIGLMGAAFLVVVLGATVILFWEELKIMSTIQKQEGGVPVYYMEIESDYHFDEFLEQGGASSDKEVSAFLTKRMSKGFYQVDIDESELACSVISAETEGGSQIWGRNYDWINSVPIIVKSTPKNGYASISTCDFQNITNNPEASPDNIANKMLAIAALYVPMDGVNEKGLCVADLEVNEGGMKKVDTEKTDLTITTAIRLILNQCATVDEAVALLAEYDIHASANISHHLAISDATGKSVVVEFVDGKQVVVASPYVTNFNLANQDISAGGESAQKRYETLRGIYEENNGIITEQQMKQALSAVSQDEVEWTTQWSIVYNQATKNLDYWFRCDENQKYSYSLEEK